MDEILGPLAFALLIGGQFLGAIVLISSRKTIYADPNEHERRHQPVRPMEACPRAMELQHCVIPEVALARLALSENAKGPELYRRDGSVAG
jgi:hypothetical protein